MDKVLEALGKLLPENQRDEITAAIKEEIEAAKEELKAEFEANLNSAYEQLSQELAEAENKLAEAKRVGEEGYQEAWAAIQDREARIQALKKEHDSSMVEQYEEAYKVIQEEREKNFDLESRMYEEYDSKLNDMKMYIVEKVDQFLQTKGKEIYENARRDILADPRMAEHKVVLDRIVDLTSEYLTEEDRTFNTNSKFNEAVQKIEALQTQIKKMEGRNIRLATENNALGQKLHEAVSLINESTSSQVINEQKERVRKAANAVGRGKAVLNKGEEVIQEFNNPDNHVGATGNVENTLLENADFADIRRLAGL